MLVTICATGVAAPRGALRAAPQEAADCHPKGALEAAMEFLLCVVAGVVVILFGSLFSSEAFDFMDSSYSGSSDGDGGD